MTKRESKISAKESMIFFFAVFGIKGDCNLKEKKEKETTIKNYFRKQKLVFFYLSIKLFSKGLKFFLISTISDSFRWFRDLNFDINIWYTSFPRRWLKTVSRHPTASANALQSSRSLESFSFSVILGISVCKCFLMMR